MSNEETKPQRGTREDGQNSKIEIANKGLNDAPPPVTARPPPAQQPPPKKDKK